MADEYNSSIPRSAETECNSGSGSGYVNQGNTSFAGNPQRERGNPQEPVAQARIVVCPHAGNLNPQKPRRSGCLFVALSTFLVFIVCVVLFFKMLNWVVEQSPDAVFNAAAGADNVREEIIQGSPSAPKKIVVIDVSGIIIADSGMSRRYAGNVLRNLRQAHKDPEAAAVILEINSPGGEVTACDEIHRQIQTLRADGKPVIACMRSMGASGGYLIAAGTDHIIANRLTMTGSIGVIIPAFNYAEMLKKIGVSSLAFTSGDMKDMLSGSREWTEKEKEHVQGMVNRTFMEFAQIVADGRAGYNDVAEVMNAPFADGRILSGSEALELGLIDSLGYLEDAYAKARDIADAPGARIVRYRQPLRLSELFFSNMTRLSSPEQQFSSLIPVEWQLIKPGNLYYLLPSVLP